MNKLYYCKGAYPDYLEGRFTQLSNLIVAGSNASNIVTDTITANTIVTNEINFSNLTSDVNCQGHALMSTLDIGLQDVQAPSNDQGSFYYASVNNPVLSNVQAYVFGNSPYMVPNGNGFVTVGNNMNIFNTTNNDTPYVGLYVPVGGIPSYSTFSNDGARLSSKRIVDDWSIAPAVCDLNMSNYYINNAGAVYTHDLTTDYIRGNLLGYTIVQNDLIFNFQNITGLNNTKSANMLTNTLSDYGNSNITVKTHLNLCNYNVSNVNKLQLSNINGVYYVPTSQWYNFQAQNNIMANNNINM